MTLPRSAAIALALLASAPSAAVAASPAEVAAPRAAARVEIAPSARGVLGAWLTLGPFRAGHPALDAAPPGVDETTLSPTLGAAVGGQRDLPAAKGKPRPPARWTIASSGPPVFGKDVQDPGSEGSRTIDLKASLEDAGGTDLVAYAAGKLHVESAGTYFLMLGVDDGVRVSVDGRVVLSRDAARPVRDDDDILRLDLAAGDHDLLLKLHQRDGAWAFRAKIVDASLSPPSGAYLTLPGTTLDDARTLAARMSWLVVDRAFDAGATPPRYRPVLTVRYPEGAPRGVPLRVATKLVVPGAPARGFELDAGGVPVTADGVSDLVVALPSVEPWTGTATLESVVAGRSVRSTIVARPLAEQALARSQRALAATKGDEAFLLPGSLDSMRFLTQRLARLVARGDGDGEAQDEEARELDRLAASLERGVDPYDGRTGMMRRAIVTPYDGAPSEVGLYVPPSYVRGTTKRYPLVVALHGLNSYPLSLMRALFGLDDEKKEPIFKDRHPVALPPVEAFVIAPYAHGNTMYREIGEDDVLYMMHWASKLFPVDEARITITGPSMGGSGSASLPLHFPHVFAAAEPLCGYHSYLIRADIMSKPLRPWERVLLEERSNVLWAENGEHLPLWIVHGTKDLPEANSGVLIERYEKLKYSVKHDHPEAGHNVWGITYADLKGMKWLLSQRATPHPSHVRFRTLRARYGTSAWVTVDELATEASWADVDARVKNKTSIVLTTSGVGALSLARDPQLVDARSPLTVMIDGTAHVFDVGEPIALFKSGASTWSKGRRPATGTIMKSGHVTGPIRDVFHEPLVFVYASDEDARANERVARSFASRAGISTSYPIMGDADFLAKGEPLANDRALFLVGRTNKVLAALESAAPAAPFPIHVESGAVTVGKDRFVGKELGAAFIHPNPTRPDRYVVVVAGAETTGTLRAMSLPDLLPDFAVWDERVAPARGQVVLGGAALRAGGFFKTDWSLPSSIADPGASPARVPEGPPTKGNGEPDS